MANWTTVHARLMRAMGTDQLQEVDYGHHVFTQFTHVIGGPGGSSVRLDRNALNQLASELQAELSSPPPGADVAGLKAFLELIRASLPINV
jgi:hypothetical protein